MKSLKARRILGVIIILCAIVFAYKSVIKVNALEKEEVQTVAIAETFARKATEKSLKESKVDEIFDENIEHFFWNNRKNVNMKNIGLIKCDKYNINTPLSFGGENEEVLLGSCGIHRDLSDTKHLTVLGHNCEQYSTLKDKLFTNIKYLNVGDRVEMNTVFGLYTLKVQKTFYVSPEEYKEGNYAALLEGDVAFATCEWHGKEKGRRIVYLEVECVE